MSAIDSRSVNCTSWTDSRTEIDLSMRISMLIEAGSCCRRLGSNARTRLTTSMVFVPGCRWTPRPIARVPVSPLLPL